VITDAEKCGKMGFELCVSVRSRFPHMFVIGITGSIDILKFLDSGADAVFKKPLHMVELYSVLSTFNMTLRNN